MRELLHLHLLNPNTDRFASIRGVVAIFLCTLLLAVIIAPVLSLDAAAVLFQEHGPMIGVAVFGIVSFIAFCMLFHYFGALWSFVSVMLCCITWLWINVIFYQSIASSLGTWQYLSFVTMSALLCVLIWRQLTRDGYLEDHDEVYWPMFMIFFYLFYFGLNACVAALLIFFT